MYNEILLKKEYDNCRGCYQFFHLANYRTNEPHTCVVRDEE